MNKEQVFSIPVEYGGGVVIGILVENEGQYLGMIEHP